jgi:ADP-ribose pyrophosphatase YjhB (NUDIX family)
MTFNWLNIAKRLEAIAQAGLTFTSNDYDLERYREIQEIGHRIFHQYSQTPVEVIHDLFSRDHGYPTPKVDIRGVIFRDEKILMVQEKLDGLWALPGGWADIGFTPREVAVKEVREEAGLEVVPERLLAVFDKKCHSHPPSPVHVYKLFILCKETGGRLHAGMETLDAKFFRKDDLPDLSIDRNTAEQLNMMFELKKDPKALPLLD